MKSSTTFLTQSSFFTPAFNAAIFDGPIRIYFAQYQEPHALRIYFLLQDELSEIYRQAKEVFRSKGFNIFVMLYPTSELFELAFRGCEDRLAIDRLGEDYIVGLKGPLENGDYERAFKEIENIVQEWKWQKENPPLNLVET